MTVISRSREQLIFAIAGRIVPGVASLEPAQRFRFVEIIDDALAARSKAIRSQLLIFLRVLEFAPVPRYGARFQYLSDEARDRVLLVFQDSSRALLRRGFWGVRTLILMGYYGQSEIGRSLGYVPDLDGNRHLSVD